MFKHAELPGKHKKLKIAYKNLSKIIEAELKNLQQKRELFQIQGKLLISEILNALEKFEENIISKEKELLVLFRSSIYCSESEEEIKRISKTSFNISIINDFVSQLNKLFEIAEIQELAKISIEKKIPEEDIIKNQREIEKKTSEEDIFKNQREIEKKTSEEDIFKNQRKIEKKNLEDKQNKEDMLIIVKDLLAFTKPLERDFNLSKSKLVKYRTRLEKVNCPDKTLLEDLIVKGNQCALMLQTINNKLENINIHPLNKEEISAINAKTHMFNESIWNISCKSFIVLFEKIDK